jgi:hypothetical protein
MEPIDEDADTHPVVFSLRRGTKEAGRRNKAIAYGSTVREAGTSKEPIGKTPYGTWRDVTLVLSARSEAYFEAPSSRAGTCVRVWRSGSLPLYLPAV